MRRSALGLGAVLCAAALAGACSHAWDDYDPIESAASAGGATGSPGVGASSSNGSSAGGAGAGTSSTSSAGGQRATGGAGGQGGGPDPGCVPPGTTGYPAEVLVDCPVAYYRLGETSGVAAINELGEPHGVFENDVLLAVPGAIVGDPDTAAHLDGVNDAIGLGDHFDFPGLVSFTLEAWVRPALLDDGYRRIFSKENYPVTGREGYLLFMRAPAASSMDENTSAFQLWVEGTFEAGAASTMAATLGVWTHMVSRVDAPSQKAALFVNGVMANEYPYAGAIVDNAAPLRWGARSNGTECFAGDIDELAIYDHALSDERIAAHHQAGLGN